ncbi:acetate non-utilizing protein 9 [Batrachochytrium dendrobatidis]|nr:acetate non-utilizing protein 9 [Batrachochytrium dendrobatidis]KAK5665894.1 acetate non-utilizing protein 9 [Batrachochytrium dendrobatidis]
MSGYISTLPDALQLYRSIRRLHRQLPPALRFVGNKYIWEEFARHRNAQPKYLPGFIKGWSSYKTTLQTQLDQSVKTDDSINVGTRLDGSQLDTFSPEQLGQLYTLKNATKESSKNTNML